MLEDLRALTAELVEYTNAAKGGFPEHAFLPVDESAIGHDMVVIGRRLQEVARRHRQERKHSGAWVSCPVGDCTLGRVPCGDGGEKRCERCFGTGSVRREDSDMNQSSGVAPRR
ncbi:hypothetical protein [Saccharothrix australiensis]|nr:hypothetical protein [Saccharothrix australiensis]